MKPMYHSPARSSTIYRFSKVAFAIAYTSFLLGGLGAEILPAHARELKLRGNQISQATPRPERRPARLPSAVARSVLQDASQRLGVPANTLRIVQARAQTFSNSCEFEFGEACTGQYDSIAGWEVVVRASRQFLVYHVDRSGTRVIPDPTYTAGNPTSPLPARVSAAVLQDVSQRTGISPSALRVTQASSKTFGNSCEFNFGEFCTKEYQPIEGWVATVQGQGQSWNYHVDRNGYQIVLDPRLGGNNTAGLPGSIQQAVLQDASRRSGVPVANLRIAQATAQTFSNQCLFDFGEVCTREYRPIEGWEVIVPVRGQSWTYHVSRDGYQVVLDPRLGDNNTVGLPSSIQQAVLQDASRRSGVPVSNLRIDQASARTFSNQCLFDFGEVCTREYRPIEGWEVIVPVRGQSWTYHVSRDGYQLALDPNLGGSNATLPTNVRNAVLRDASQWSQVPTSNIRIVEAQAKTWSNRCDFSFGQVCTMDYQPVEGWEVKVSTGSLNWVYRTNQTGTTVLMDRRQALPPTVANAITQDVVRRAGSSVRPNALRFLEAKEETRRVCTFLVVNCRNEQVWLTVVSDGRQQWGYQAEQNGQRVQSVPVAQVLQSIGNNISGR